MSTDDEFFFISVAARMLGMHPQTLRKYERLGLIQPGRTIGSMRVYSRDELERLKVIKRLVGDAGINLAGVQRLLSIAEVVQRMRPLMRDEPLSTAFLSLGGISTRADAEAVEAIAAAIDELAGATVKVANDAIAALVGGLSGRPGMVLIAGTGSACYGVGAGGRSHWCGGWEHRADDAGSAYWIAIEALRTAVRVEDGRLPPSALRDLVFNRWPISEPRALAERLSRGDIDRATLATLAPEVIALAASDALAKSIVDRAADELAQMVAVTAARLFAPRESELILTGGLARSGPPFTPLLVSRVEAMAPGVKVVESELSPVLGAVIEAARLAGAPESPEFLRTLRAQQVDLP
jgi:N-acetylglucosamine kinase-like BadF-type ATPase